MGTGIVEQGNVIVIGAVQTRWIGEDLVVELKLVVGRFQVSPESVAAASIAEIERTTGPRAGW